MEKENRSQRHFPYDNTKAEVYSDTASSSLPSTSVMLSKNDIIRKEIDQLFGPALERTRSGSDIDVAVPLRQKKRQCRSQEVLSFEKPATEIEIEKHSTIPSLNGDHNKLRQVSALYDNQRAEIIASVTERLYNKLKQNEKAVTKMESMVDKKIMQPLHELKICSNARQRLVELSQKAMRHKRKIGIPVHTQTKKYATRVKDQEIDVQSDLQPYYRTKINNDCVLQMDVSTETVPLTPRYREVAVGSKSGMLHSTDRSTVTESASKIYKNSFTMTDNISKCNSSTQTSVLPPPRKKKNLTTLSKYFKKSDTFKSNSNNKTVSPIINITISPVYSKDIQSSEEPSDVSCASITRKSMIPDVCRDHCPIYVENEADYKETNSVINKVSEVMNKAESTEGNLIDGLETIDDFSDEDDFSILPRVAVEPNRKVGKKDYEELILGHNCYPYNLKLSPYKEMNKDNRVIKFNNIDITPAECCSAKWLGKISDDVDSMCTVNQFRSLQELSRPSLDLSDTPKKAFEPNCTITEEKHEGKSNHKKGARSMYGGDRYINTGTTDYCKTFESKNIKHDFKNPLLKCSENKTELKNMLDVNSASYESIVKNDNKNYVNDTKLTPTEYLKTLIQIRREAVAAVVEETNKKKSFKVNFIE